MVYCSVLGCNKNQKKTKEIHFYRFPKDPVMSEKWTQFCGREPINTKNARICSLHFEEKYRHKSMQQTMLGYSPKNRRRLLSTAIPTLKTAKSNKTQFCESADTVEVATEEVSTPNKTDSIETRDQIIRTNSQEKYRQNLLGTTSDQQIEDGVYSLNVNDDIAIAIRIPWKDIYERRDTVWKNKMEELQEKYEKIEEENKELKKKLSERSDFEVIGKAVKRLLTPGHIR